VTEDGIPKSPAFSLPESESKLTLTVHRGSRGMRRTGEGLIGLGIAAQAVGFSFGGGDPVPEQMMAMPVERSPGRRGTFLAIGLGGLIVAGIGLLLHWRGLDRVDSSTGRSFHLSD
jgi:hypothetical protein